MKPFVWRGGTGRWWVSASSTGLERFPGVDPDGYETWREAYDAACLAIAADPA